MKFIKRLFIFLVFLIVVALVAAAFLPRELKVKESKIITAPVETVFNLVNDYKNQPQWNPWAANDNTMKFEYSANTVGKGAAYSWTSENSGEGSQLIIESVKNELVRSQIEFVGMGQATADYDFEDLGDGKTKLTWRFRSEPPYPFNLINFYSKMQVGESFNLGLDAIDRVATERTRNGVYNGYTIVERAAEERTYLTRRAEVPADNINQYYTQQLPALYHTLQNSGLDSEGKPAILFNANPKSQGNVDVAAGLLLANDAIIDVQGMNVVKIPAGKAFEVQYQGDFDGVFEAHQALSAYLSDKGLLKKYPLVQEFVTDTSTEADPSKWITKVIYYVAE